MLFQIKIRKISGFYQRVPYFLPPVFQFTSSTKELSSESIIVGSKWSLGIGVPGPSSSSDIVMESFSDKSNGAKLGV